MSAIAGVLGHNSKLQTVDAMLKTMNRRGPDQSGVEELEDGVLLHTRLAVIDLNGGRQPMKLLWRDIHYNLLYDGELYNAKELRHELECLGHRFLDHSDTEVLLHSYVQWGAGCLERLNGIFAFAVWEEELKQLFLARDRIGVKPLFYTQKGESFLFASEIKTLLASGLVPPRVDAGGVGEIMLLGPGRTPGCGVFQGIKELKPGCFATYRQGKLQIKQYWRLEDRENSESMEQVREHVRELVMDAIRRQLVSDVPIGTFLSGGLDSSLISAVAAKERGGDLATFSVDYRDNDKFFTPGKFQPNSDSYYISKMVEYLGTDHHWVILDTEELADALDLAVEARDLPGMADVDSSLLLLCRKVKDHATVVLSGECADEIFGGYPWYRDPEVRSKAGFPWAQSTAWRSTLLQKEYRAVLEPESFVQSRYEETCANSHILSGQSAEEHRMKEMVNLNFNWFMQTLSERNDRMSMYSGLEVRVPYCDYRIAEYLYTVPWGYKDWQGREKGLLRSAMEGWLPEEVLWRKKSPYPKTHNPAYGKVVAKRLEALLEQPDAPIFRMVDRESLRMLLTQQHQWPWYGQLMAGPQTIAYMLQVNHWLEHYRIELV